MRSSTSNTSGWLAYVLLLVVATGCSLALAMPIIPSSAGAGRFAHQQQQQPQPQQQARGQAPIVRRGAPQLFSQEATAAPEQQYQPQAGSAPIHPDAMVLARDLFSNRDNQAPQAAGGLSFNNHVSNINIGNTKHTTFANQGHVIMPKKGSSLFSNSGGHATYGGHLLASTNAHELNGDLQPVQAQLSKKLKKHATPEQRAMKRKLLELAEKATASPEAGADGSLLKFNHLTEQFEPVSVDPNVELYKQKLQKAIKALSAKKLPADKLRQALEGIDNELQIVPQPADQSDELDPSKLYDHDDNQAKNLYDGEFDGEPLPQDTEGLMDDEQDEQAQFKHPGTVELNQQQQEEPDYEEEMNSFEVDPGHDEVDQLIDRTHDNLYDNNDGHYSQQFYDDEAELHRNYDDQSNADDFDSQSQVDELDGSQSEQHDDEFHGDNELAHDDTTNDLGLISQVREALDDRLYRISDLLYFRTEFMNQLTQIQDVHLTPIEREFKRMVLCNSDEQFCDPTPSPCPSQADQEGEQQQPQQEMMNSIHEEDEEDHEESGEENPSLPPEFYDDGEGDHQQQQDMYENEHAMPPVPHHQMPPMFQSGHQVPHHYLRSSSSVYYAQNHHEQMSHMGPNGVVSTVAASSAPAGGSGASSHAMSAVSDGRGGTIVQQSLDGAPAQIVRRVSVPQQKQARLWGQSLPKQQQQQQINMVPAPAATATAASLPRAGPVATSAPAVQQMARRSQPQQLPVKQQQRQQQQPQQQAPQQRAQVQRQQQPRQRQVPAQQQQQQRQPAQMRL